jgi:hypothetical protein
MSSRNEPTAAGDAGTWKPRLFRVAYLTTGIGAMIAWLIALSWAGLSVFRLFV